MLVVCILSALLGALGAWLVALHGHTMGLTDYPNERSSHSVPTPKGGGIGILAAFCLAGLFLGLPWMFVAAGAVLSLFSLMADKREVSPKIRLLIHGLITLGFLWSIYGFSDMPGLRVILLAVPAVFFIVGSFNLYNFMDGINGIAGVTAVTGFGLFCFYSYAYAENRGFALFCAALLFACIGFLPFNMPRARVFMGDVGSILLGFAFSAGVIMLSENITECLCLAGLMFPFYADEITTMYARLKNGENVLKAHRRHFYQILCNQKGIAHWKVSLGYGTVQGIVGIMFMAVPQHYLWFPVVCWGLLLSAAFCLSGYVRRRWERL